MQEDLSPEGRLLALIKRKKHDKPEKASAGESPSAKTGREDNGKRISFSFAVKSTHLNILNRYLAVIFVILLIYLLVDILFMPPRKQIKALISRISKAQKTPIRESSVVSEIEITDYSKYAGAISGKKIFGLPFMDKSEGSSAARAGDDALANLNLVGIIAGNEPQAIIEDKKSQKTYYLTKGQSFDGIIVEDVSSDKVTLNYNGRKFTLVL